MPEEVLGKPAMIKVLVKEPNEKWHVQEIENTLKSLQGIVGGYIETVTVSDDAVIIRNKEGRLMGLPFNCKVKGIAIDVMRLFVRDKFRDQVERLNRKE